jgi:dTDP-4-amino-4,6-dideoxygalactose transaminase
MKKKIKLFDPDVQKEEVLATKKVLESKFWASGAGIGKVLEFENKFNNYVGSDYCVALSNGTAALHLALSLLDVENKEVILPSLSFVSTAHAVLYNRAKPVFVDVDQNTLCIDPEMVQKAITKNTAVILPVHFGGMPSRLDELHQLCNKYDITLIEDAAHAAGSSYKNRKIGSHSVATCFSFHPVKNLAMPTGGAITLNGKKSDRFDKILRSRRWCGISHRKGVKYDVTDLGWNYYMNEFSAAIGIEQLKKLDKMNSKRIKIARRYSKEIDAEIKMPFDKDCVYHLYWIQVKNRENFMRKMQDNNIETGIHYRPIHTMTYYKEKAKLPVTEEAGRKIVSIPIHANLDEFDVDKIIKLVNRFS